jgi:hypothetical protein
LDYVPQLKQVFGRRLPFLTRHNIEDMASKI